MADESGPDFLFVVIVTFRGTNVHKIYDQVALLSADAYFGCARHLLATSPFNMDSSSEAERKKMPLYLIIPL